MQMPSLCRIDAGPNGGPLCIAWRKIHVSIPKIVHLHIYVNNTNATTDVINRYY